MYRYDAFDEAFVRERTAQFRDQVARRLRGELSEDEFRPLRLMNGLYLQLHAYMLRVAIPYGVLSSRQMRQLAMIAERWDKGYGHFTTRQNIQFNWIRLEDMPDVLATLAQTHLHAMQTSGNCIRNITSDQWAGVARDEVEDPRIYAEIWFGKHVRMTGGLTFIHDLIETAGGQNIFGDTRKGYLELDLKEVERRQPEIFLVYSEPELPMQAADLARERGWNIPTIQADISPPHNIIHDGPSMMTAARWLHGEINRVRQESL